MLVNKSAFISVLIAFCFVTPISAQRVSQGKVHGTVRLGSSGILVQNALVIISETKQSILTDERGVFEFPALPFGRYQLIAHLDRVADAIQTVDVTSADLAVDFELTLATVNEQVTVSATGSAEAVGTSYQPVTAVGSLELVQKNTASIGEALEYQPGIAKRSFGPGSGRPVIRGFDGDRVLVLQDGLRLGGIASQSGDEVEPVDVLGLDRIEIVKGPATLLYGSNAIGGVVNGISTNDVYQRGLSGYLTTFGATNSWQAGAGGGLKYGLKNFLFFGSTAAQKANDYHAPSGTVINSYARSTSGSVGLGWFPHDGWLSFSFAFDRRHYGIPAAADEVDFESLKMRRQSFTGKGGWSDSWWFIEHGDFAVSYNDYLNREFEFESDKNVTELDSVATNRDLNYRISLHQRRRGKLLGMFGFSGFSRDYQSIGKEAPAPHTRQNSFAAYALERIDSERLSFQFGGRLEQNGYDPEGGFRNRNFVGFSGSAGVRVPLWVGGSITGNYQHSFRAPALEELYNNGPHRGILVFDVGNQDLGAEQSDGIDVSLRHQSKRLRLEGNAYYYNIRNFIFTAFTGETDVESNLPIVNYAQAASRFLGSEASMEIRATGNIWINGKIDYARAELKDEHKPLPRIPPLRATVGFDWHEGAFIVRPELIMASRQTRVFDHETQTPGYAIFNVSVSYAFVTKRAAHILSLNGYNLGNTLYRNHLSFIKDIAPEIGRYARLNYTVRF